MTSALRSFGFLFGLYALMLIICGYKIDNDTYYLLHLCREIVNACINNVKAQLLCILKLIL